MKSIFIAIPTLGNPSVELVKMLGEIGQYYEGKYKTIFDFFIDRPIDSSRNKIVKKFLLRGYDYLLMLDDDVVPPVNVLDLATYDKDIIGGLYFGTKAIMFDKKDQYVEPGRTYNAVFPLAFLPGSEMKSNTGSGYSYKNVYFVGRQGLIECNGLGASA